MRRRRLVQVREDDRELGVALERARAGEAFVEDAAERVDVGARIDRPPSICSGGT